MSKSNESQVSATPLSDDVDPAAATKAATFFSQLTKGAKAPDARKAAKAAAQAAVDARRAAKGLPVYAPGTKAPKAATPPAALKLAGTRANTPKAATPAATGKGKPNGGAVRGMRYVADMDAPVWQVTMLGSKRRALLEAVAQYTEADVAVCATIQWKGAPLRIIPRDVLFAAEVGAIVITETAPAVAAE